MANSFTFVSSHKRVSLTKWDISDIEIGSNTISFGTNPNDRFFIYTDGLIENINAKEELLESTGLLQILNQYRKETNLKAFKDSVISKIVSFYGKSEFTDDAMFLAFEIE